MVGPAAFRRALAVVLALGAALAAPAGAACRQALVLAVDISGSVDPREHGLQRRGIADALLDPEVQAAFLDVPEAPVRLLVFEWAGPFVMNDLTGWTEIRSADDLAAVADRLTRVARASGGQGTATGQAMLYGGSRLQEQAECGRLTLDVSTDGLRNAGITPGLALEQPELAGVTVNGLAVGTGWPGQRARSAQLDRIVRFLFTEVIRGPGAFVEVAEDFDDFARAIRKKLLRELIAQVLGNGPAPPQDAAPG